MNPFLAEGETPSPVSQQSGSQGVEPLVVLCSVLLRKPSDFLSSRATVQANMYNKVETAPLLIYLFLINQKHGNRQLISRFEYLPVRNVLVTSDLTSPSYCAYQRLSETKDKPEGHSILGDSLHC